MIIRRHYPPNFTRIASTFTLTKGIIFTYGKNIYNPDNVKISDSFMIHERVHMGQQGEKPGEWWDRYLIDAPFRLSQEVAAYRKQFGFFRIKHKKQEVEYFLTRIATDLSSGIYGEMIDLEEAKRLISV